ncbi:MAG: hypothetical protein Q4Q58_03630 [Thermoplasmata archaeon]|nr:hypothetical protein [Thermoplasmata archaeon]
MDAVRTRKLSRLLFYVAAMGACLGLGLAMMDHTAIGVVLLLACMIVMVVCLSILKFMGLYDYNHMMSSRKPKKQRSRNPDY